jgi:hypothetical protein
MRILPFYLGVWFVAHAVAQTNPITADELAQPNSTVTQADFRNQAILFAWDRALRRKDPRSREDSTRLLRALQKNLRTQAAEIGFHEGQQILDEFAGDPNFSVADGLRRLAPILAADIWSVSVAKFNSPQAARETLRRLQLAIEMAAMFANRPISNRLSNFKNNLADKTMPDFLKQFLSSEVVNVLADHASYWFWRNAAFKEFINDVAAESHLVAPTRTVVDKTRWLFHNYDRAQVLLELPPETFQQRYCHWFLAGDT